MSIYSALVLPTPNQFYSTAFLPHSDSVAAFSFVSLRSVTPAQASYSMTLF